MYILHIKTQQLYYNTDVCSSEYEQRVCNIYVAYIVEKIYNTHFTLFGRNRFCFYVDYYSVKTQPASNKKRTNNILLVLIYN